ncbi:MAG: ABC transporter permease [Microbacteriaceae bacterium]
MNARTRISPWITGVGTIAALELRQRVRSTAWYVLLGVVTGIVVLVTLLLAAALGTWTDSAGGGVFSTIIYFVLLLTSLVTPALSGNAINGDREAGTLATTQVTLIRTSQLVVGKFLAAWTSALAFLVATVPMLIVSMALGGLDPAMIVVAVLVLAVELGVVSAIGVGLSGLMRRPLFSIVVSYLAVALLSIGTLIGFVLGGLVVQTPVEVRYVEYGYEEPSFDPDTGEYIDPYYDAETGQYIDPPCTLGEPQTVVQPRFDLVWWMLAANPYVVLADAVPTSWTSDGSPDDLFGWVKVGVRSAQLSPSESTLSQCDPPTSRELVEGTVPSWFVGLAIHVALGAAALLGATAVTRAPSRRLARGSRIA